MERSWSKACAWFQPGDDAKTYIVLKPIEFNIMSISALAKKLTGYQSIRCRKNTQQVIGAALERTTPRRLGRADQVYEVFF
jgi:hypothetical protein